MVDQVVVKNGKPPPYYPYYNSVVRDKIRDVIYRENKYKDVLYSDKQKTVIKHFEEKGEEEVFLMSDDELKEYQK